MSHPGMGVMIGMLGGNEKTVDAIKGSLGKKIAKVAVEDNRLKFEFADGSKLTLFDDGQSCCEHRYMVCDDDLAKFVGRKLTDFELADGPTMEDCGEPHEVQFLKVYTSRGSFTVSNHNEHNGYYGGFWIVAYND